MDEFRSFWVWLRRDVDCFPNWAVATYAATLLLLVIGGSASLAFATIKLGWSVPIVVGFIVLWVGWSKMYALHKREREETGGL